MRRPLEFCALLVLALIAGGCGRAHDGAVAAATPEATASATAPALSLPRPPAAWQHGDHNPHHGGVVYMYDDMHYEVVLDPGRPPPRVLHRFRTGGSAGVGRVERDADGRAAAAPRRRTVNGAIDPQGESWMLDGQPVADKRHQRAGSRSSPEADQYWIDVPFIPSTQ